MRIYKFAHKYSKFAMDYPCKIEYRGILYSNALKAFASCRFIDEEFRIKCEMYDKKTLEYIISEVLDGPLVVPFFKENMYTELYEILKIKFSQAEFRQELLSVGIEPIVYISKKDLILGKYNEQGLGLLGSVLTDLRKNMK